MIKRMKKKLQEPITDPIDGAKGIPEWERAVGVLIIIAAFLIVIFLSGCSHVTGQSAGVTHGIAEDGMGYHAPHYTVETERVDVGIQHYRFNKRENLDFTEIDWNIKF